MKKKILIVLLSLFALVSCGASNMVKKEVKETYDYAENIKPTEEYKAKAEMASDEAISEGNVE